MRTKPGSRLTLLVSQQDYDEYARRKTPPTRSLKIEELSDETVEALVAAKMDERHTSLNALMDD